jgi:ABC-type nitrate/sulfonate/bicarbonate transport system substrate-binding protein
MRLLPRFPVAALLLLLSIYSTSAAQDRPLKKINWGVTSLSGGNWIPWIAKEAKIYEKHGLDVELILFAWLRSNFSGASGW